MTVTLTDLVPFIALVGFKFVDETSRVTSAYRGLAAGLRRPPDSPKTRVLDNQTNQQDTPDWAAPPSDSRTSHTQWQLADACQDPGQSALRQTLLPSPPISAERIIPTQSIPRLQGSPAAAAASFPSPSTFSVGTASQHAHDDPFSADHLEAAAPSIQSPSSLPFSEPIYNLFNAGLSSPEQQPTLDLGTLLDQVVSHQGEIQRGYDEALRLTLPTEPDERGENGSGHDNAQVPERELRVTRRIPRGDRMMMRLMRHYVEVVGPWVSADPL
jgi:hypothetical protein